MNMGDTQQLKTNKPDPYMSTSIDSRNSVGWTKWFWNLCYGTNLIPRKQYCILFIDTYICIKNIKTRCRRKHTKYLTVVASRIDGNNERKEKGRRRKMKEEVGKQRRLQFTSMVLFLLMRKIHLKHKWQV